MKSVMADHSTQLSYSFERLAGASKLIDFVDCAWEMG